LGNNCRTPDPQLIVLGEARVVGKIIDGQIIWHEAAAPIKTEMHYIITKAVLIEIAKLQGELSLANLKIRKLEEIIEKTK